MRFVLIDRIVDFEKGKRLKGTKVLSLAEEYLKDHFPRRPILPGVLMLESLVQAGGWLLRLTNDFQFSTILTEEVKSVRFAKFVSPGDTLEVEVQWLKEEGEAVEFNGKGTVGEETVIAAKFKLRQSNLVSRDSKLAPVDAKLKEHFRSLFSQIVHPAGALV